MHTFKTKQHFQNYQQQQQAQFLESQKNCYEKKREPKRYKKVVYEEEPESELELEEEEEFEDQIEEEPEIKKMKKRSEKRKNNVFDYINKDAKRNKHKNTLGDTPTMPKKKYKRSEISLTWENNMILT